MLKLVGNEPANPVPPAAPDANPVVPQANPVPFLKVSEDGRVSVTNAHIFHTGVSAAKVVGFIDMQINMLNRQIAELLTRRDGILEHVVETWISPSDRERLIAMRQEAMNQTMAQGDPTPEHTQRAQDAAVPESVVRGG